MLGVMKCSGYNFDSVLICNPQCYSGTVCGTEIFNQGRFYS